jgi:PAS domain S-box-containing protein
MQHELRSVLGRGRLQRSDGLPERCVDSLTARSPREAADAEVLDSARVGDKTGERHEERIARVERQLATAQQLTHIGSWEWDIATNVVTWSDELYRIYGLEPRSRPVTFEFFLSCVHPDDRALVQREVRQALERGGRFAYPERIVRPDGSIRQLDTIGEAVHDACGRNVGLIGTCRDVTDVARARRLREAEHRALEQIATGAGLAEVLATIALAIEEHSPPTLASVLLLDSDGMHVRHGAAPHLPPGYTRAIDGATIGPAAGSCGTAAYLRRAVFVEDIETDPLWVDYRGLAREHGLRACWSSPIFSKEGRVLGTFALYYREPRKPSDEDLGVIERATHVAGIAIEQRQLEEQLRALSAHAEAAREDERTGIAREIHDVLGQALTAIKMDLAWLARRVSGDGVTEKEALLEKVAIMSQTTDDVIQQVRRISTELRPGVLDDLGLLAAIEWQAQEFEERTGTVCTVESNLAESAVGHDLATAAFRIFQEALTNVARHASAKQVDVQLLRDANTLRLQVRDDGRGITPTELGDRRSLGLLGMRERARRLGGAVTIAAVPEGGTVVSLRAPLGEGGSAS